MTNNLILIIFITISYAGYNLFIKLSGSQNLNNSNSIAATLFLQLFALSVTLIFSLYLYSKGEKIFVLPSKSYIYAIFAGISIGFAEIGYFYIFNESNPSGASKANTAIPTYRESSSMGIGIWKSIDGGNSWTLNSSTSEFKYITDI